MTEEDTFNTLLRIPYEEMFEQLVGVVRLWNKRNSWPDNRSIRARGEDQKKTVEDYLKGTGWSFEDFFYVEQEDGRIRWQPRTHALRFK